MATEEFPVYKEASGLLRVISSELKKCIAFGIDVLKYGDIETAEKIEEISTRETPKILPPTGIYYRFFDRVIIKVEVDGREDTLEKDVNLSPAYWPGASIVHGPGGMGGTDWIKPKDGILHYGLNHMPSKDPSILSADINILVPDIPNQDSSE